MKLEWYVLWEFRQKLFDGLLVTLWLSAVGIVGSTAVGTIVGCMSTLPSFLARRTTAAYVELLRNVPLVVKLFFFHFIVGLDGLPSAIIALILHQSAYVADVTSAGLRSVPRGQTEAALACGHSYAQVFAHVLVPQAVRIVLPPLTTQYIQVVKNSSVVMLIAIEELSFQTQYIDHQTFRGFEASIAVTALYLAIVLVVSGSMSLLQWGLARR